MELRALRTGAAPASLDGCTVLVLDDRLVEALRDALDRSAVIAPPRPPRLTALPPIPATAPRRSTP